MIEAGFPTTALYVGLNVVIAAGLGITVTVARARHQIPDGDSGSAPLRQAIRAHANNAEYVPFVLIALGALESLGASPVLLHGLGGALTVARLAHAQGMYQRSGSSPGRVAGAMITWLVMLIAGGASLYHALV